MEECHVVRNGWRSRDTGPCHPLRRVKCQHGPGFTLYPPGHYPRGREPVVPMSPKGEVVRVVAGDEPKTPDGPAWYRTLFGAVLDAARGLSWSRESPAEDPRRRRTQRRYIVIAARLLGLAAGLEEEISQRIADGLGVAYLVLSEQRSAYQYTLTYEGRGAAIVSILEMIPQDRSLAQRLLTAGFMAGLWGRPKRWDPG